MCQVVHIMCQVEHIVCQVVHIVSSGTHCVKWYTLCVKWNTLCVKWNTLCHVECIVSDEHIMSGGTITHFSITLCQVEHMSVLYSTQFQIQRTYILCQM